MTIWIVLVNGMVWEVFDTKDAAEHEAKQQNKLWSIIHIVEKQVKFI